MNSLRKAKGSLKIECPLAIWVFLGGGFGCLLRYCVICVCERLPPPGIPLATLIANVTGCLAIGILSPRLLANDPATLRLRTALLVGVIGGFTTFSTFALESYRLVDDKGWPGGLLNIAAHNIRERSLIRIFPIMLASQRDNLIAEQDHGSGSEGAGSKPGQGAILERPCVGPDEERPLGARLLPRARPLRAFLLRLAA